MVKNGFKIVYTRDVPLNNNHVIIQLARQRFLCCICHHSIIAQMRLVDKHAQIFKRFRITVIAKLAKVSPVEDIAQDLNLFPNTINKQVINIHNENVKSFNHSS